MQKGLRNSLLILIIAISTSCTTTINNQKELLQWIGDKNHGYVKKNQANGFELTMKYLPPQYLALNEMQKDNKNDKETYNNYYNQFKNSRTFLLTIAHEDNEIGATNYNIQGLAEYTQRIKELSFNIKKAITLQTSSQKKHQPVLTTLEDQYEIRNKKNIYIVFSDEKNDILNTNQIDITFHDTYLDTGINHFVFDTKKIDNLPTLNIIKK